jgi:hypothetical protein
LQRDAETAAVFHNALITAISLPGLDASSKDAGYFIIRTSPELVRYEKGDSAVKSSKAGAQQKKWLTSNFEREIAGMPAHGIGKIGAFTIETGKGKGYFSFEYSDEDDVDGDAEDEDAPQAWASFNLNYFRPSYFAREAAGEIEAFVRRFGRAVSDPQLDGMGDADFSEEGFLRGWQRGNSFAFEAFLSGEEQPQVLTRSTQELTRVWQWNSARRTRQEAMGDDIFVPRIGYFLVGGQLLSAAVWADGIPVLLPRTDAVVVFRDEFAPRRWFRRQTGVCVVPWQALGEVLSDFRVPDDEAVGYRFDSRAPPPKLIDWIKSLPATDSIEQVAMDQVLDAELAGAS